MDCASITAYPWVTFPDGASGIRHWKRESNPHQFVQVRRCYAPVGKAEFAQRGNFAGSIEKTGHCGAIERSVASLQRQCDNFLPSTAKRFFTFTKSRKGWGSGTFLSSHAYRTTITLVLRRLLVS